MQTIKMKGRENMKKYNNEIIRETIMASNSMKKVRRMQMLGQDILVTFLEKQGREIQENIR